ncbi:MAG: copper-translocating P-type ATPase [Verrucomicrobiales bacterium]|nr:copper-translocating P-type ATPase [Verrucomicrobiales bacterium]
MQVTALLSQQDESDDISLEKSTGRLGMTFIGLVFVLNGFAIELIFESSEAIAGVSAFIGAFVLGAPILMNSIKDLRRGQYGINELVSLAILASLASGDYRTAGVVAFFMLIAQIIETRTAAGARASIESLIKLTPTKARRLVDGKEEETAAKDLKVGDIIRVRPGDNVAADGVIVNGQSTLNQANVTGESLPVDKKDGEEVFAGTINLTGALDIRVSRAGTDTTLGRVRELILMAEQSKLPIMRIMDQYMGYYTPLVLTMAALIWVFTADLNRVIAVLVVSCPCAFILATPSAMVASLSAAARLGVLIKNIGDIELAAKINAFVFDKTGTLTSGKLAVARMAPVDGVKPAELLKYGASAEQHSNHPVAKALVNLAKEAGVDLLETNEFNETAGRGITADIGGARILAGRAKWLIDNGVPEQFQESVDLDETEGFSIVFVAKDGKCIGWCGLRDQIREEASEALLDLQEAGAKRIAMVTGDRKPVATRVAGEINCEEVVADCLPQNKVEFVKKVKEGGWKVAVVGDGVNDAPALASGDIGIAMGAAGSEVAIHSATIALMNSDLRRLPFLIRLSRATRNVINQNFMLGLVFITGGLSLAAVGYLNPIVAAIMHNAGSILVICNSARLVRQGEELEPFQVPDAPPGDSAETEPVVQPA